MSILIKNKKKGGFSLVELLIVISIFTIVTTIALFDQGRLNSNVLLTNLAYDVALTVREAQSYGVGVKYSATGANTAGGYGVYLSTANKEVIVVFHDVNANGVFDEADGPAEKTYQFLNQRGNHIEELCGYDGGTSWTAGSCLFLTTGKQALTDMSITFKRPDPEANFKVDGGTDFSGPAYIVLMSQDKTNCRAVVVEASGQIRVEGSDSHACKVY